MHEAPPENGHESIHLPGGSWWPIVAAIGIALLLTGLVVSIVTLIIGAILVVVAIGLWVRDARREYAALHD